MSHNLLQLLAKLSYTYTVSVYIKHRLHVEEKDFDDLICGQGVHKSK